MKFITLLKKAAALDISKEMVYKTNFFIKIGAIFLADIIGPLMTFFIYTTTAGIPGWGFYEFLMFQGTLLIVFGSGRVFVMLMPYEVIDHVKNGEFDKFLVKPYNTLLYLTSMSFVAEGIPEVLLGVVLVVFSAVKLSLTIVPLHLIAFLILIVLGFFVQYASMITIASLSFLFVRSDALMNFFFKISDFARYPLNVYSTGIRFFITFIFPIAVSAYYPVEALIRGISLVQFGQAVLGVGVFFVISLFMWEWAMKHYSSAGG